MLVAGSKATGSAGTGSSWPEYVGVPGSTAGGMSGWAAAGEPAASDSTSPAANAGASLVLLR